MQHISYKKGLADHFRKNPDLGMVVSEKRRLIYMKAPKTAGTSILRSFLEKEIPDIINFKTDKIKFNKWLEKITDKELEGYFIFSVIRNPWDRLVSISSYFKIPFNKFINAIDEHRKQPMIFQHSRPLSLYTHLNGKQFVDYICRFECLQADINIIFDKISIKRQKLPFVNRSNHKHYTFYYTKKEVELVKKFYKEDIMNFGYSFNESKQPLTPLFVLRLRDKIFYKIFGKRFHKYLT